MPIENASEQLSAYLDGELTEVERDELEAELARDPALRAQLTEFERVVEFLRVHGPVQAPDDFHQAVLDAVEGEAMPGGWWAWLRRPFGIPIEGLAIAAAAAAVLLLALPVVNTGGSGAMRDLVGDPRGYVAKDEIPSLVPAASEPPAAGKTLARPPEEARPEPEEAAPPPAGTKAPPEPSTVEPTPVAGTGEAEPLRGPGYRYTVLTTDPEALLALHRIAARYRGEVLDAEGRPTKGATGTTGTWLVELPSSELAAFGDALRGLGRVQEVADDRMYTSGRVRVQVDLQQAGRARKRAPSTETYE